MSPHITNLSFKFGTFLFYVPFYDSFTKLKGIGSTA
jgi:hypothetical protein